jgi:tetratricopeptide (TPR) repeat protein
MERALHCYRTAIAAFADAAGESRSTARNLLVAREGVSRAMLAAPTVDSDVVGAVESLDRQCRLLLKKTAIPRDQIIAWRDAVSGDEARWWWSPDVVRLPLPRFQAVLNVVAWLSISVALTALIQVARRAVNMDEFWGVVVESYLALLVTGTIVQFARHWVTERSSASPNLRTTISMSVLALILVAFAITAVPQIRKLAVIKSNEALWAKERGDLPTSVDLYEQAMRLEPDNAVTHYNLGRAAEAIANYELADREFRSAIRFDRDRKLYGAWFGIARLALIAHHDPATALRFLDRAEIFSREANLSGARDASYALGKYRSWAYLDLKQFQSAGREAEAAIVAFPQRAAAHCIRAQVLAAQEQREAAAAECGICLDSITREKPGEVEPSWIRFAKNYAGSGEKAP